MALGKKTLGIFIIVIIAASLSSGVVGYYIAPRGAGTEEAYQEGYQKGFADGKYPNGVLKVAVLGPLTGALASEGEAMRMGAEWAVEEINALGGICGYKLELVVGDTEDFEPAKVTALIEKMVNEEKVAAIFCGYGSQALVEYDVCAQYNMLYFIGADWMAHQDKWAQYPEKYKTCFNIVPSYMPYRYHFPETFDRWVREGKLQKINNKVAIVYSDNYYSSWIADGLKENFIRLGYNITLWEMVPFGTVTEWGPILAKIRADPPAVIINTDYIPSNEAAFVEQFLEAPTNSHMFIQYGPSTPEFVQLLGNMCTGIYYNSPSISIYTPGNKPGNELLQRGIERFGSEPPGYTFTTYQEVWIYKQACEIAHEYYGADPKKPEDRLIIAQTLREKTAWWGTYGLMVFDETNCLSAKYAVPTIYQLWEGQRFCVEPAEFANADPRMPPWWH
jgi:branched-chain amino acid transport system substrate-binding protein